MKIPALLRRQECPEDLRLSCTLQLPYSGNYQSGVSRKCYLVSRQQSQSSLYGKASESSLVFEDAAKKLQSSGN